MGLIKINPVSVAIQGVKLAGAGSALTNNAGFSADNIEGMPAANALVDAMKLLDDALEAYQQLIDNNGSHIVTIAKDFMLVDQNLAT